MSERTLAELREISLFTALEDTALREIGARSIVRTFPKNVIVVNEGDRTDSLYLILSGRVKVYSSDEEGREVVLNHLGPDEYFGELAVIDAEPRSASIMTLEPAKLAIISRDDFMHTLIGHPQVAINLLRTVIRKLRREGESVKSLALMDVYGRVAKLLLEMAQEKEGRLVAERLTYRDLASRIGASREMIGRIFKDLKTGGYITLEGDAIIINKQLPDHW